MTGRLPAGRLRAAAAGAAVAGGAALAYAGLVERRWYRLRHVTVPALSARAARPLRLLHLSDLHFVPGQDHKVRFVRAAVRSRPELVVATGDLLGHTDAVEPVVDLLAEVVDGSTGIVVLGSNDLYAPQPKNPAGYLRRRGEASPDGPRLDTGALVAGLRGAGWHVVDNRRVRLPTAAGTIDVTGLGDPHIRLDRPETVDWSASPDGVLRLGVVHAPYLRALDAYDRAAFDLVLAGHTHGGQIRLPGLGPLIANCDLPLGQARGLSRFGIDGRMWLHVSAGLGTSRYAPVRFACPPEASLLDLVPRR